jgi:hypothetical protein
MGASECYMELSVPLDTGLCCLVRDDYTTNSLANATRIVDPRLYFLALVSESTTDLFGRSKFCFKARVFSLHGCRANEEQVFFWRRFQNILTQLYSRCIFDA